MKKILILLPVLMVFCGCATNQFKDNYNDEGLNIIKKIHVKAKIIETTNLQERVLQYADQGYVVWVSSHLGGEWEARIKAKKWAEKIGAPLVIIGSQQTGTQEHQYTLAVPQVNTTYHQGSINTTGYHSGTMNSSAYTYGNIGNSNFSARTYGSGSYSGMSSYNTTYSGTSTSVSTSFVSGAYETAVFDQLAVFMIPKEQVEIMSEYSEGDNFDNPKAEEREEKSL